MTFQQFTAQAPNDFQKLAQGKTLQEFWDTCPNGVWMVYYLCRANVLSVQQTAFLWGMLANDVRPLMSNPKALAVIDVAIKFGLGKATLIDLNTAHLRAWVEYWHNTIFVMRGKREYVAERVTADRPTDFDWSDVKFMARCFYLTSKKADKRNAFESALQRQADTIRGVIPNPKSLIF